MMGCNRRSNPIPLLTPGANKRCQFYHHKVNTPTTDTHTNGAFYYPARLIILSNYPKLRATEWI